MNTSTETKSDATPKNEAPAQSNAAPRVISFGNGKYSSLMEECFTVMTEVCGMNTEVAEKWARSIGSQVGLHGEAISPTLANSTVSEAKGKDKTVSYKEKGGTVKKIVETYPLRLHRILGKIVNLQADDIDGISVKLPSWVK